MISSFCLFCLLIILHIFAVPYYLLKNVHTIVNIWNQTLTTEVPFQLAHWVESSTGQKYFILQIISSNVVMCEVNIKDFLA